MDVYSKGVTNQTEFHWLSSILAQHLVNKIYQKIPWGYNSLSVLHKGSKLERLADKMREISSMIGRFMFYVSLPDKIKLLLFDIFFFDRTKPKDIKIQDPGPTHACLEIVQLHDANVGYKSTMIQMHDKLQFL